MTRSRRPAGKCGTRQRARGLRARAAAVTRELVYGRNAVREALRGPPRGARALGLGARGSRRSTGSARARGRRSSRSASSPRRPASPDHQGVVAWASPYPYADPWELAAGETPLLACLDQVTDPRNLGAVIRSAAGAGATGRDRARARRRAGDAGRLPLVGRHGRAPAGRRRPEPGPLPRRDQARRPLVVRRDARMRRRRCGRPTSRAASRSSSEPRARACARSSARPATRSISIPLAAGVESLNVSVAAAVLLYEARRQRGTGAGPAQARACRRTMVPEPTLYLFDGYNLLHAGGRTTTCASSIDELASFVAMKRRARRRRLRRRRRGARARAALGALRAGRRHAARAARGRAPRTRERSASSPPTWPCGARPGQEVRKVASSTFLRELEPAVARRGSGVAPARPARPGDAGEARAAPPRRSRRTRRVWPSARVRTPVLITVQILQRGCNACKKVLGSPSSFRVRL